MLILSKSALFGVGTYYFVNWFFFVKLRVTSWTINTMNGQNRKDIKAGITVEIVLKQDQRTGRRTRGIIRDILTNSPTHPHGIKVRLEDGQVGRVQEIFD